jgi:NAD(P)-dependent dehydrogenase (short-subunit alcohol dehydrogenase family)
MIGLEERVALVTGAGGGIGRGIAHRLASAGSAVAVNDAVPAAAEAVAAEIEDAGGRAAATPGDVAESGAAAAIVAAAEAALGPLDILVNNAGVTRDAWLHRMTDDEWRLVEEVVLYGTFCMCRAAAPALGRSTASHNRKVVNVASAAGVYGYAGTVNYSASKAGVIGLTKALAREWAGRRVNVNAVAPGLVVNTRITEGKPAELMAKIEAAIPLGRPGQPADVAALVHFLASSESDYVTGQVVELHGGLELLPL